jgi:hypothetical protein
MVSFLLLAGSPARGGETPGRQLSPADTDRAINAIFAGAQGIFRMEADIETQKSGGMLKGQPLNYEFLRLEAPDRMWLENRGNSRSPLPLENCNLVIVDGRNLWEVEPRQANNAARLVNRRRFSPQLEGMQTQGMAAFIGLFLLGRDAVSASGLRGDYDIKCWEEALPGGGQATLHFVLQPLRGGENLELWVLPGQPLPWKVRSFQRLIIKFPPPRPGEAPRYRMEETIRVIRNVRTNQNGLPPFTANSFLLPLARDMQVRDEQDNRVLTPREVGQELEAVRALYQQQHQGR